jgi:hypothetical protein
MAPHITIVNNSEINVYALHVEDHWYKITHPFYFFILIIMMLSTIAAFARVIKMRKHKLMMRPTSYELVDIIS